MSESDYRTFLDNKHVRHQKTGFKPSGLNHHLKDFQAASVDWFCRTGRAGAFEGCGLGKSLQELVFAEQVVRHTNKPAIIFTPLAVGWQFVQEAEKFGIEVDVRQVKEQADVRSGINVANYERLHKFDMNEFSALITDEGGIMKSYTGATKRALVEKGRDVPFKLTATATPSPNDLMELGNQAEFLSAMRSPEMLARWFINTGDAVGKYKLRPYGARDYWNWVASWAVCFEMPSDIGFSDEGYVLPSLSVIEHVIEDTSKPAAGHLIHRDEKISATTTHKEKRKFLEQRVAKVAALANGDSDYWVVWCDTDYEADALKKAIPDAIEVRGSQKLAEKEEKLSAFSAGKVRVMITKPRIGGFGLNWQHCHKTTWFAGWKYEEYYQAIRRLYRFGQVNPVDVHLVMTEQECVMAQAIRRKQGIRENMNCEMAISMRLGMMNELGGHRILQSTAGTRLPTIPSWLVSKREESLQWA